MSQQPVLCIVGLGYVGLPLAHAFAAKGYAVLGFDISERRIGELNQGHDSTGELTDAQLQAIQMTFSTDASVIAQADIVIVALPTPVDDANLPDLHILEAGTATVGKHLKRGAIVVFESTVYPGTTEEICGPILEKESGMTCGTDFTLGYSPERINPGDKEHTVTKIKKIVSGQDAATLEKLLVLYGAIVQAGVHAAPNIKVAEMAKAIENAQRDLNIAFVNEVALLCNRIGIGTQDVLAAAKTKWNFLPFSPGLVGGHCIGVDPYYLVEKARQLGMKTHVITAGRAVNDSMGAAVAEQITTAMGDPTGKTVLVLGLTFKENVPDTRNSKVPDVVRALIKAGCAVRVHDPVAPEAAERNGFDWGTLEDGPFDAVALLVPHHEYLASPVATLTSAVKDGGVLYDLKGVLDRQNIISAGKQYLSL
jgi:UDP-N-acetyl-D-galactosamine dehydrogenase